MKSVKLFCYLLVLTALIFSTLSVEAQAKKTCGQLEKEARDFVKKDNNNLQKQKKLKVAADCYKNTIKSLKDPYKQFKTSSKIAQLYYLISKYKHVEGLVNYEEKARDLARHVINEYIDKSIRQKLSEAERKQADKIIDKMNGIISKTESIIKEKKRKKELENAKKQEDNAKTADDFEEVADTYANLEEYRKAARNSRIAADKYKKIKNCQKATEMYKKAIEYWEKAAKIAEEDKQHSKAEAFRNNAKANRKLLEVERKKCNLSPTPKIEHKKKRFSQDS